MSAGVARSQLRRVFLTPAVLLMIATFAVPMIIVAVYSFMSRGAKPIDRPHPRESCRCIPLYLQLLSCYRYCPLSSRG